MCRQSSLHARELHAAHTHHASSVCADAVCSMPRRLGHESTRCQRRGIRPEAHSVGTPPLHCLICCGSISSPHAVAAFMHWSLPTPDTWHTTPALPRSHAHDHCVCMVAFQCQDSPQWLHALPRMHTIIVCQQCMVAFESQVHARIGHGPPHNPRSPAWGTPAPTPMPCFLRHCSVHWRFFRSVSLSFLVRGRLWWDHWDICHALAALTSIQFTRSPLTSSSSPSSLHTLVRTPCLTRRHRNPCFRFIDNVEINWLFRPPTHSLLVSRVAIETCARFAIRFIDNVGSNWLFRGNEPVINGTFANTELRASIADVSRAPVVVAAGSGW
jgi:hypothetical protein